MRLSTIIRALAAGCAIAVAGAAAAGEGQTPDQVRELIAQMRGTDAAAGAAAARSLWAVRPEALCDVLAGDDKAASLNAVAGLRGQTSPRAVEALHMAARDPSDEVRAAVVAALGEAAAAGAVIPPATLERMELAATERSAAVRSAAVAALAKLPAGASEAALVEVLRGAPHADARIAALELLAGRGGQVAAGALKLAGADASDSQVSAAAARLRADTRRAAAVAPPKVAAAARVAVSRKTNHVLEAVLGIAKSLSGAGAMLARMGRAAPAERTIVICTRGAYQGDGAKDGAVLYVGAARGGSLEEIKRKARPSPKSGAAPSASRASPRANPATAGKALAQLPGSADASEGDSEVGAEQPPKPTAAAAAAGAAAGAPTAEKKARRSPFIVRKPAE